MNSSRVWFPALAALMLPMSTALQAGDTVSFRKDLAPILLEQCLACHGPKKAEGGFRVDAFERLFKAGESGLASITSGDLDESEMFRRIASEDDSERMPLESDPLPDEQIELFRKWIADGARFDSDDPAASLVTLIPPPVHPAPPAAYRFPVPIAALAFSLDGTELFVGGYHEITVWDPISGELKRRIGNIGQRIRALDLHSDGKTLAVGCGAPGRLGETRLMNVEDGSVAQVLGTTSDEVLDVAFSPAGDRLATAGADSMIRVFDVASGDIQRTITSHSDWVTSLAWSADGTRLVSGSRDKTAKVFDAQSGELQVTYSGHNSTVYGVAFHPEAKEVFSSGGDQRIHRWKIEDAKKVAEVRFGGEVYKLPSSGEFIFAASADKTVRQFEAKTQKQVRSFAGHQDWALCVAHHPKTQRLASGSFDGTVRVWNQADGEEVVSFRAAPGLQASEK